jgi:ABC-type transport system involved in cytochrome c biogenesis permease subunit
LLTIGILSGQFGQTKLGVLIELGPERDLGINYLVCYLLWHTRISKGWTGQRSAFIASFGFIIIWICYLGVNLLGKGLHSYGFS